MLVEFFGNYPRIRVIDLLISNPYTEYTKTDIAECAKISRSTLYDFFEQLEEYNLIKRTKKYGGTQLYQVDSESPAIKALSAFQMQLANIEIKKQMAMYLEEGDLNESVDIDKALKGVDRAVDEEILERQFIRNQELFNPNELTLTVTYSKKREDSQILTKIKDRLFPNILLPHFTDITSDDSNLSLNIPKYKQITLGAQDGR